MLRLRSSAASPDRLTGQASTNTAAVSSSRVSGRTRSSANGLMTFTRFSGRFMPLVTKPGPELIGPALVITKDSTAIYAELVTQGSLAVAAGWLSAVNHQDTAKLTDLSAEDIEIIGPRGSAHGRQVLAGWLARAGFAASTLRWFCGADGNVVVEQDARWSDPAAQVEQGRARVASRFVIHGQTVAAYQRHDTLDAALAAAGLTAADEVTG